MLDECFIEFLPEPEKVTMQGKLDEYPNLLILRAFTKIYAMPGLRLGYLLCSDEDLLDRISRSMQSWNVSTPAQMAGLAALNEDAYVKEARELIGKRTRLDESRTGKSRSYRMGFLCKLSVL